MLELRNVKELKLRNNRSWPALKLRYSNRLKLRCIGELDQVLVLGMSTNGQVLISIF